MKTKILLIGLTIFLVNVISVNARETIKACAIQSIEDGVVYMNFPSDGGKPNGEVVELSLVLTNKLNLELIIIQEKRYSSCIEKLKKGEIDILPTTADHRGRGDVREYIELIPYYKCPSNWECTGNKHLNFGISKKSKYISRVNEFKTALLSQEEYALIFNTKYTSSDQHDWDGKKKKANVVSVNGRETIKACGSQWISKGGFVFLNFPSDGGKPNGYEVELLLKLTNKLNLELIIIQGKDYSVCLTKAKKGEIDIIANVWDDSVKKRGYMEFIPYYKCPSKWKCPGNKHTNFGISKKSKYFSKVNEFKTALLSQEEYALMSKTNFTSSDQHNWGDVKEKKKEELVAGQVSVPSIEKLFQNNTKTLQRGELFYGCIIKVKIGKKDLLKQKNKINFINVGNSNNFRAIRLWHDYYLGDDGSPKINDCYVFKSRGLMSFSIPESVGWAEIVEGNFKIENVSKDAITNNHKKEISVDEYFEDNLLYGKRRLVLNGEVDKIEVVTYELQITLVSSEGKEIITTLHETEWEDDEKLANELRSIKVGSVIKVRGYFDLESDYGNIFKIQNIINFGN